MKIECFRGCFEYTITTKILKLGSKLFFWIYIVITAMMPRESEERTVHKPGMGSYFFSLRRNLRHARKAQQPARHHRVTKPRKVNDEPLIVCLSLNIRDATFLPVLFLYCVN